MSSPFFNTPERIAKLVERAETWRGTPWRLNSCACAVGVSCHNLPRALYVESGALSEQFPRIDMTPQLATATDAMEGFLNARAELARLKPGSASVSLASMLQPGDLVGLFIPIDNVGKRIRGKVVNHLGVMLRDHCFAHVLMGRNTTMNDRIDSHPWSGILCAAWRVMER